MATQTFSITRRIALGSLAAVVAVTPSAAGASLPRAAALPSRAAWDTAMSALNRAVAASDAFDGQLERITRAYMAAVADVPHVSIHSAYHGRTLSTADPHEVRRARHNCQNLRYVEACAYEGAKIDQQFVDAADKRDAAIAEIDRRTGYRAAHKEYEALTEAIGDAETVLLDMPAPDGQALMWKVTRLYTPGEGIWGEGVEDQTVADLRRMLAA